MSVWQPGSSIPVKKGNVHKKMKNVGKSKESIAANVGVKINKIKKDSKTGKTWYTLKYCEDYSKFCLILCLIWGERSTIVLKMHNLFHANNQQNFLIDQLLYN